MLSPWSLWTGEPPPQRTHYHKRQKPSTPTEGPFHVVTRAELSLPLSIATYQVPKTQITLQIYKQYCNTTLPSTGNAPCLLYYSSSALTYFAVLRCLWTLQRLSAKLFRQNNHLVQYTSSSSQWDGTAVVWPQHFVSKMLVPHCSGCYCNKPGCWKLSAGWETPNKVYPGVKHKYLLWYYPLINDKP